MPEISLAHIPDPAFQHPSDPAWSRIAKHLAVWFFLLTLAWIAHFSQCRNMGFYSDDQTFAVRPLAWTLADFTYWLHNNVVSYPEPQGRPLGFALGILFPYLGDQIAGVNGMFYLGWWILTLNAILFYHLLHRCFAQPIPILGTIAFLLFPSDTTRPFLCHQHILQPSLTFLLIAFHLYLGGGRTRRILAYFAITLCLITYESALLPFFAVPLLERARDQKWRKGFIVHLITLFGIIVFIGITRKLGHEYRTEEVSGSKSLVLLEVVAGTIIGPVIAIWGFALRAYSAVKHLLFSPTDLLMFLAAAGVFRLLLPMVGKYAPEAQSGDIRRATSFGAAALGISYLLSFTHFPPVYLEGQTTSVHLAAAIGASTLFAAGASALLQRMKWNLKAIAAIAIYLALLLTWAQVEQDGYVTLWRERQQFWTRLMDVCPDLEDQTIILCDGQLPQPNWLMPVNCWSDTVVLEQTYQLPLNIDQPPQVNCFPPGATGSGWRTWIARDVTGKVVWTKPPYGRKIGDELIEGKTILLRLDEHGSITRLGGSVEISGKPFRLVDPVPRRKLPFATMRFYDVLTGASR